MIPFEPDAVNTAGGKSDNLVSDPDFNFPVYKILSFKELAPFKC
jgi:hypothetical protein